MLAETGLAPLEEWELVERAGAVWNDFKAGKIKKREEGRSVARTDVEEIKDLCGRKNGGNAVALLMLLRCEHQARILRGETFSLNVKAMVEWETMPGWTIERFRNAIRTLLDANYLKVVEPHRNRRHGRTATQYTLVQVRVTALQSKATPS
jgi:hypothetical protein